MDRVSAYYIFSQVFGWSLIALYTDSPGVWSREEATALGESILGRRKISGETRMVQDRFARIYQDLRIVLHLDAPGDYEWLRDQLFSSWKNWGFDPDYREVKDE